ncbi:MAG: AraC family transcriptional regulator [Crocinitomicaceae bacterium]|nr:AraC family transcriptional regulator [Crocinitomicaceae bacterium]|tara:strand:+ start:3197 stop:4078 length:882 start_codon:yes stop_codon:yes gene_type:complete
MKDKIYFEGIYGEDKIELIRETIHISKIEFITEQHSWFIKPHAHRNLFQVFLLEEGDLELNINDDTYNITGKSFFTIPKNVLHGFNAKPNIKGWIITLSDIALERILALDTNIIFDIDEFTVAKFDFDNQLYENLYVTIHKCIAEYNGNLPAKEFALEYLVGMLLIRLYRIPKKEKNSSRTTDNAYKIYYRRFLQLIKEHYSFKVNVQEYAKELGISSGHLNFICQTIAGKSPKEILIDYFISEAKSQLELVDQSVADISYNIGFDDPSYFTRLFKAKTEMTPNQYRKQIGVK